MENKLRKKVLIFILIANFLLLNSNFMIVFGQGLNSGEMTLENDLKANQPPNEPSAPSPYNNSYGMTNIVEMSVYISDPNGDPMDVEFYNASSDQHLNDTVYTGVDNGTYSVNWTGLSTNHRYYWYVVVSDGSNSVTSDTWTFSTSTIDSIDITDTPGGSSISSKKVSAGFEESVNCSAYNQTAGYIGTVSANWTAEGGDSYLLKGNDSYENTINVGSEGGDVWLNSSYDNKNFIDSVLYTVKSPTIDYIEIVDTANNGSELIQDTYMPIYSSKTGYSAAFNNSIGYMRDVDVNWSITNDGTNAVTEPINSNRSILNSGSVPGNALWKANYNENITDTINITIYDNIPPDLTDKTNNTPTTGDLFQFKVNVTDEVNVSDVFIEYNVDQTGYSNRSMIKNMKNWTYSFIVPSSADNIYYSFKANDTSNNWNSTPVKTLSVVDNDPASISLASLEEPNTGGSLNITADVSDNKNVSEVYLDYSIEYIDGYVSTNNVSMEGNYYKNISIPLNSTKIDYIISAVDGGGNWNSSDLINLVINDDLKPQIFDTSIEKPRTGDLVNVSAKVYDNIDVQEVYLNYSMVSKTGYSEERSLLMNDGYFKNVLTWSNATVFNYHISARDTSNNWNESQTYGKEVEDDDQPAIIDKTPTQVTAGDQLIFNASVDDNIGINSVYVYFWTDITLPVNESMIKVGSKYFEKTIKLPANCTQLYYNISASDESSNWAQTGELSSDVNDEISPSINITTGFEPTTGEYFNITANISDNIGVKEVWLEYLITDIDGKTTTDNVTMNEGSWYREIGIPVDSVMINYTISAVDKSGNWESITKEDIEVIDNDSPIINLNQASESICGDNWNVNITVSENIQLDQVFIEYWTDVTDRKQQAMSPQGEKFFESSIEIPVNSQELYYNFTAVDMNNNKEKTKIYQQKVIDRNDPEIRSVNVSPDPTYFNISTNFTCDVSDNIKVSKAYINIFGPDNNSLGNYSMPLESDGEVFYHSDSFQNIGTYHYLISAVDTSNNWITTNTRSIEVKPPKIDHIQIRDKSGNQGEALENISLEIEDDLTLYAAGYNETYGYQRDLRVSWASSNNDAMVVDNEYGVLTNCTPVDYGSGKIHAFYDDIQTSIDFEVVQPQDPTIIGELPDLYLEEDFGIYQLNLSEYASDLQDPKSALKWYIAGLDEDIITLAGENLTGNHNLNLISQKNKYGSMKVTYWLVDSEGNKANKTSWINVTSQNDPPVFKDFPDLYVRFNKPYPFDYGPYITDSDDPIENVELTTDDPSHTVVDGLTVTYEYPEDIVNETVYVTLTASDGSESNSRVVRVTVTADYPPENVKHLPDIVLKENETKKNVFDLDDYIQDPDEDSLYMSYGYTHLDITIHDNHTVDMKAPKFWNGFEKVTFRATDPIGAVIEQTINVTVTPVNSPPEMKPLPKFVVHYDHPYNFDLRWYISDPDNNVNELDITTSNPDNVSVIGTTLRMIYPKNYNSMEYPYTVPLTVSVSDGLNSSSRVTNVTVTDDYPPDIISPLSDVIFDEDETVKNAFDLDEHFKDRDSDTVYYTSGNENVIVDIKDNNSVDFSAPKNWHGSELITIRATDNRSAFVEDTFRVFVLPVNDPPIIKEIPDQTGEVGNDWVLDLEDYIYDVDNDMEELSVSVNTSNIIVAGHKLIFTYPRKSMEESVQITVSDGSLENDTGMNVTILESESKKSTSIFDSPYIYTPIPILLLLFGLLFYITRSEYSVDDIFLIHDSGILIEHTAREMKEERDDDILAGMFTAVQNFVKDAFADEDEESLKRMEYGDKKVLIHKGDFITLAVFFTGDEPKWALDSMENLVNDIEDRYEGDIEDWSGDTEDLPGVTKMLEVMLDKGKYKSGDWEGLESN